MKKKSTGSKHKKLNYILYVALPIIILMVSPIFIYILWSKGLGSKISSVCLAIQFIFLILMIVAHFRHKINDHGFTLIETMGNAAVSCVSKTIRGKRKRRFRKKSNNCGLWIADAILVVPLIFCYIPVLKIIMCLFFPSILIMEFFQYHVYLALYTVETDIQIHKKDDPLFVDDEECRRGAGCISCILIFISFASAAIVTIIWGFYLFTHLNIFF